MEKEVLEKHLARSKTNTTERVRNTIQKPGGGGGLFACPLNPVGSNHPGDSSDSGGAKGPGQGCGLSERPWLREMERAGRRSAGLTGFRSPPVAPSIIQTSAVISTSESDRKRTNCDSGNEKRKATTKIRER